MLKTEGKRHLKDFPYISMFELSEPSHSFHMVRDSIYKYLHRTLAHRAIYIPQNYARIAEWLRVDRGMV